MAQRMEGKQEESFDIDSFREGLDGLRRILIEMSSLKIANNAFREVSFVNKNYSFVLLGNPKVCKEKDNTPLKCQQS